MVPNKIGISVSENIYIVLCMRVRKVFSSLKYTKTCIYFSIPYRSQ